MSSLDRVIFALIACALWVLVLGDLIKAPTASAQATKAADRQMSLILQEIVAKAIAGEAPSRSEGYDELESRLRTILSRTVQAGPQTEVRISRQDIRAAFASCRIVGTLHTHRGHLNARLSC